MSEASLYPGRMWRLFSDVVTKDLRITRDVANGIEMFRFEAERRVGRGLLRLHRVPQYTGHVVLYDRVAVARIDDGRTGKMKSAIVPVAEADIELAESQFAGRRTEAATGVVEGVVDRFLAHDLRSDDEAVTIYNELHETGAAVVIRLIGANAR